MSIRSKLIFLVAFVSLVLGAAVWQMLSSTYQLEQKVKLFVPATGYLMGIAEVNTGLTRQVKEALDYLATRQAQERDEFRRLVREVEKGFDMWIRSAESQGQMGVEGESEDIETARKVEESYRQWVENVEQVFSLIDQGQYELALHRFEQDNWLLLERQVFSGIDAAMADGFNEVENAYHELLVASGGILFSDAQSSRELITTHAAIDYVIGGCRVNSAISRQFSALINYLLTGADRHLDLYEELKVEVRGEINEWFFAARERGTGAGELGSPVAHVTDVVAKLEHTLGLGEEAVILKKAGKTGLALKVVFDSPLEGPIGEHLPIMVFTALQAGSQELVALASSGSRKGVLLISLAFICAMLLILHMSRHLLFSLRQLQAGIDAVSSGNLQQQINLKGRDELAKLAGHFNQMASNLKQSKAEIEALNSDLEERVLHRTHELAKANQELDAYNAAVSHDLRSPLTMISGYSQLLLESNSMSAESRRSSLQAIFDSGQAMARIINALQDLSRMSSVPLSRVPVDLSGMAREIMQGLKSQDLERRVNFKSEPNVSVNADLDLMLIAMENLLSNAWKYSADREEAEIELGVVEGQEVLTCFVRDNGAGFDMSNVDKLFRPFQRLHLESEFKGTGVGLSTVQRIIQRHGGDVWAEGEVEGGATFYFSLPGSPQESASGIKHFAYGMGQV